MTREDSIEYLPRSGFVAAASISDAEWLAMCFFPRDVCAHDRASGSRGQRETAAVQALFRTALTRLHEVLKGVGSVDETRCLERIPSDPLLGVNR